MAPTNVVAKALRGGSYLFLQKIFTFALNSFVLRKLQLSITGAVTVRLELALASIFFLRDGFRLAFLRMPSLDMADNGDNGSDKKSSAQDTSAVAKQVAGATRQVQKLVNVAWLSTAMSWAVALAIIVVNHPFFARPGNNIDAEKQQNASDDGLQDYALVMVMYCVAAMIEALAEPMYVLAHCSVLVSWQVSAQGAGFLARAVVQYVCIFGLDLGLLAYGFAEIAYAMTLFVVFAALFWKRMNHGSADGGDAFALTSMVDLLPRAPRDGIDDDDQKDPQKKEIRGRGWFHPQLLSLLVPLSLQSAVKYLLTEGDKWVLSLVATFENMGVYGIVFHLGSLVPRIVFLPMEEATKTIFSKFSSGSTTTTSSNQSVQEGYRLVMVLLKIMNLIGLVFVCFGANYAHTLVLLLYGVEKARLGVSDALAVYCGYIYLLGLNGICEAFVHAVGDAAQLMRLNKLMGGFFVLYALSAFLFVVALRLGTIGIILANGVNMACRITYCMSFMTSYFKEAAVASPKSSKKQNAVSFWRQSLPDRAVVLAFVASFAITATSRFVLLSGEIRETSTSLLLRHAAHVAIGIACFVTVLATVYWKERHVLPQQLKALRQQRQTDETKRRRVSQKVERTGSEMPQRKETSANATESLVHANTEHEATQQQLRAEIKQVMEIENISLLAPWTAFVARDATFSDEMNACVFLDIFIWNPRLEDTMKLLEATNELTQRVRDAICDELEEIYWRLKRQQAERDAMGMMPKRATRTLLENQLVVEAKRHVDRHRIAANIRTNILIVLLTMEFSDLSFDLVATVICVDQASDGSRGRDAACAADHRTPWLLLCVFDVEAGRTPPPAEIAAEHAAVMHAQEEEQAYARRHTQANAVSNGKSEDSGGGENSSKSVGGDDNVEQPPLLSVRFPKREQTLLEAIAEADAKVKADNTNRENDQVTHFRNRPVMVQSVIADAGKPTPRRKPPRDRVRYIMSTRLGALPPTKNILDEHPIPKEILDALEKHRHFHVDASSLMTSFDAIHAGGGIDSESWECYVRRSVPVERKPISFVLSSLEVVPERPVPPPSDIFHQHVLESATNDDLMLTEFAEQHELLHRRRRDRRKRVQRRDPERLQRSTAAARSSNAVSKWRVAKSGVNRIAARRGAIAVHVKTETNAKAQRTEWLNKLCTFTPHEIQLMDMWYSHDSDNTSEQPFDPVPMSPDWSARFDAVWHELQMPAKERLDFAVKYSTIENSPRLADAVVLWETTAAIVKKREELLALLRESHAVTTTKKSSAIVAEESAMLQELANCTENLKEILLLTYLEVGDFVTLGGNFYLARMEHEATELRQIILDSVEGMKRRSMMDDITEAAANASAPNTATTTTAAAPTSAAAINAFSSVKK
ncbi:Protein rft1, partial [Globisporangium splendens]